MILHTRHCSILNMGLECAEYGGSLIKPLVGGGHPVLSCCGCFKVQILCDRLSLDPSSFTAEETAYLTSRIQNGGTEGNNGLTWISLGVICFIYCQLFKGIASEAEKLLNDLQNILNSRENKLTAYAQQ